MTPLQCRLGRVALGLTLAGLGRKTDISEKTLRRLEAGHAMHPETVATIEAALGKAGVIFSGATGVRLASDGKAPRFGKFGPINESSGKPW